MGTSASLFHEGFYTNKPGLTCLFFKATIGSNGAPTLVTPNREIASIGYAATGVYTVTLRTAYHEFLGVDVNSTDADVDSCWFTSEDVATGKTIVFTTQGGGSAVEPSSSTYLLGRIWLRNSEAKSL